MALVPLSNLKGDPGVGSHGVKTEPTDLDALRGPSDMGTFAVRLSNTINGPDDPLLTGASGDPLLNVLVERNASNGVVQHVTTAVGSWYRHGNTSNTFYAWRRSLDERDFPVVSTNRYASLVEGQTLYVVDENQAAYDFAGAWPNGFARIGGIGGAWILNTDPALLGGRGVRHAGAGGFSVTVWGETAGFTDGDVLVRHQKTNINEFNNGSLAVRAHADGGSFSGYHVFVVYISGEYRLSIARIDQGTSTTLQYALIDMEQGKPIMLRFNCEGSALRAKAWIEGTREPETWTVTTQDSTYSTGAVGFRASSNNTAFDVLSVSNGWEPAA